MRITAIEIKNFRAFKGQPLKIGLTDKGCNLLVYGENGSGKSSLYFALRDFLECGVRKSDITKFPFCNLFARIGDGYIKLNFADPTAKKKAQTAQAGIYEWSATTNKTNDQLVLEINKTKGFIDYKALLTTYFLQQNDDQVNIFDLLIGSILEHAENDFSRLTFGEEWREIKDLLENLNKRSPKQREGLIERVKTFNDGLRVKLQQLQSDAQTLLDQFGYGLGIEVNFGGVEYDSGKHSIEKKIIGLKVTYFNETREDHHRFLNEAKLSSIAISIFFAALLAQPKSRLRILALDDVLIGLDMSNRLPVLDILVKHFSEYQIFFFTYDCAWYEIVKQRLELMKAMGQWKHIEFFAAKTDEQDLPIFAEDKKYLDVARDHFNANDYKAAVIYLRTHFETVIKKFCEKKGLKVRYTENPKKLDTNDFWEAIKTAPDRNTWMNLTEALVQEVELCRSVILNPLSHSTITSAFKKEIDDAINAIAKLETELKHIK